MCARDFDVDHLYGGQRRNHPADELIARLANAQGGVVARRQLLDAGITARAIERRLDTGRLRPIHRGVYAVGHDAIPVRGRLVAALLVGGSESALSHGTAAHVLELLPTLTDPLHVSTPGPCPRGRPGLVFHAARFLPVAHRHGLPVTTPLKTLQDLAATAPATVERAAREALARRLVAPGQLTAAAGPGSAVLARLVGAGIAPTRSELERRFLRLCRSHGLPLPLCQHRIGPYTVDFAWPEHRLVVETDGARFHDHPIAAATDRARDAYLQLHGWNVLRLGWHDITASGAPAAARVAPFLADRPQPSSAL